MAVTLSFSVNGFEKIVIKMDLQNENIQMLSRFFCVYQKLRVALGLAIARTLGHAKFAYAPLPGLKTHSCPGSAWEHLKLTDA